MCRTSGSRTSARSAQATGSPPWLPSLATWPSASRRSRSAPGVCRASATSLPSSSEGGRWGKSKRKEQGAQQHGQAARGEIVEHARQALLRLHQRILQRPVHIGQVGLGPAIVFVAFQHGRSQVQLRQHVAQAGRQPFAALEFATEHEHRHIRHDGKRRRQPRQGAVVGRQCGRAGIGHGRQARAAQSVPQSPGQVAQHKADVAKEGRSRNRARPCGRRFR